jgi:Spy/CpxP family protein refolding chaperone
MKRIVIWSSVAVLLVACGIGFAVASARGCHRWGGRGWGRPVPLRYLAHELDLSREQSQQIRSMWQTERPAMLLLLHEFAAESKEMDAATVKGNLDEGKVQEIAARQGSTVARFLVEKEHFKARIYAAVLTPEQRTKADELQSRWHDRLGKL